MNNVELIKLFTNRINSILSPDYPKDPNDSIEQIVKDMSVYVWDKEFISLVNRGILIWQVGHEDNVRGGAHGDDNYSCGPNSPWYDNYFLLMRSLFKSSGDYAQSEGICSSFIRHYLFYNHKKSVENEVIELLNIPQFGKKIFENYKRDYKEFHTNPFKGVPGNRPVENYPEPYQTLMSNQNEYYTNLISYEKFENHSKQWKDAHPENIEGNNALDGFLVKAKTLIMSLEYTDTVKREGLFASLCICLQPQINTMADLITQLMRDVDTYYPIKAPTNNLMFSPSEATPFQLSLINELYKASHPSQKL